MNRRGFMAGLAAAIGLPSMIKAAGPITKPVWLLSVARDSNKIISSHTAWTASAPFREGEIVVMDSQNYTVGHVTKVYSNPREVMMDFGEA